MNARAISIFHANGPSHTTAMISTPTAASHTLTTLWTGAMFRVAG